MNGDLVSRRGFVSGVGGLTATVLLVPEAMAKPRKRPSLRGGKFAEGVLSGDPTPRGITLWTRVADAEGTGTVEVQVARDRGFHRVVAHDLIKTNEATGHYAKARIGGLAPYEQYYYRFATRDEVSPIGRFRTALPPDSHQPVRFAFFSCQDYNWGYFNAHSLLVEEDVDFVLCLGDYIYAEKLASVAVGAPNAPVRTDPVGDSVTLDDYRTKYAVWRSDPRLRRMHAKFPMISIWDDHEVLDDYAGGAGPTGGLDAVKGYSNARKAAAYRAYFESMPTFGATLTRRRGDRIYRALRFGRNVDLILLDERQYRADQPCGDALLGPACAELNDPRALLGRRQMSFVKKRLASTPAAWKVLANQVTIERTYFPGGEIIGFDSWMGYPRERTDLLGHIKRKKIEDVVFVTGDIHTFIAGDVRLNDKDKRPVATEFVGGSITSQALGEGAGNLIPGADPLHPKTPEGIINALKATNPWAQNAEFDHHGYALAVATRKSFRCSFKRVREVKKPTSPALPVAPFKWRIGRGEPSLID